MLLRSVPPRLYTSTLGYPFSSIPLCLHVPISPVPPYLRASIPLHTQTSTPLSSYTFCLGSTIVPYLYAHAPPNFCALPSPSLYARVLLYLYMYLRAAIPLYPRAFTPLVYPRTSIISSMPLSLFAPALPRLFASVPRFPCALALCSCALRLHASIPPHSDTPSPPYLYASMFLYPCASIPLCLYTPALPYLYISIPLHLCAPFKQNPDIHNIAGKMKQGKS